MIAMRPLRKNEPQAQINVELCRLSMGFKSLSLDHQKSVLKTARGLLRIQRACRAVSADKTF